MPGILHDILISRPKVSPDLKSISKNSQKPSSKGKLIEGQLKIINRRGIITLETPGKGLKGKFTEGDERETSGQKVI